MAFLRLVDDELRSDASLVIVGGAAIALAYRGRQYVTSDIDVFRSEGDGLEIALASAASKSDKPVPVTYVGGIGVIPLDYEDRIVRILEDLKRLTVHVPERHDLAIMKIARGTEHDLAGVEEVHVAKPLSLDLLVARFEEVLPLVTGPLSEFQWSFLAAVNRLFSNAETDRAKQEIERLTKEFRRRRDRR